MTDRSPVHGLGLRSQILLILFGGAILPLALVGLWLTFAVLRSGEDLLRRHLDASADAFAGAIGARWEYRRADLALIAGNESTVRAARGLPLRDEDRTYLDALAAAVARTITRIELRDAAGRVVWTSPVAGREGAGPPGQATAAGPIPAAPAVQVETPISGGDGRAAGTAVATITLSALVPPDSARPLVPGAVVAIRDAATGSLLSLPAVLRAGFPEAASAKIDGESWLATRRTLTAPALDIAVAAPLSPYVAPFRRASRLGITALVAVALVAFGLTALFATRATRPLRDLVSASDAVTTGHLEQRVATAGPAEIRRVATAFNVMTANLRETLDALSRRNALAAVGEFATSLSHDVRNSLTAVRLDLERAARRPPGDASARELVGRALDNVARLDNAVSGALRVARNTGVPTARTDLRSAIHAAVDTVRGTFVSLPAALTVRVPDDPVMLHADAPAIQQVVANLLFNAAQALSPRGRCTVVLAESDGAVEITVSDSGKGMSEAELAKLDAPFYSSKAGGTGMGLTFARQIVAAHGGELSVSSRPGRGTDVRVRLPRWNGTSGGVERDVHIRERTPQQPAKRNA